MFLISNKLEELGFKLEKIIGIQKREEKVRKQIEQLDCLSYVFAFHNGLK